MGIRKSTFNAWVQTSIVFIRNTLLACLLTNQVSLTEDLNTAVDGTPSQSAIYGLKAYTRDELGSVVVIWNGTSPHYQIQYKEYSEPRFQNISSEITGNEYNITSSLLPGVSYFIKVLAFDKAAGSIIGSDQVLHTTTPLRVTFLKGIVGDYFITYRWNYSVTIQDGDYMVDFKRDFYPSFRTITFLRHLSVWGDTFYADEEEVNGSIHSLTYHNVTPFSKYTFKVSTGVRHSSGPLKYVYSDWTSTVVTTEEISPTKAPKVTVKTIMDKLISISWTAVEGEGVGIIRGYKVSTNPPFHIDQPITVGADKKLKYTFEDLKPSTDYEIRVQAYTAAGDGPYQSVFDKTENFTESQKPEESSNYLIIPLSIALPVVVIMIISLVSCLICRQRRRKRKRKKEAEEANGVVLTEGINDYYITLSSQLSEELKIKIKKMYIDPNRLSYNSTCDLIGKGTFGNVYLGKLRCKEGRKSVAVKTLKDSNEVSRQQVEEFLDEACFLQDYNHINILRTLGIVWKKGYKPAAVLPHMAHGDLCTLIRRGDLNLTNGDLIHFGMQVATGMEYLTSQKCLHRDLAARNCLVDDSYLVKIADFGMSKDIYCQNYYRESSGDKPKPVKWMAIESLQEAVYNSTTEVWSFGVLMWELLTRGSIPYPEVSNSEILLHLNSGHRLSKPPYSPDEVFNEIAKCWDVDSTQRPTFTQLCEFLQLCLNATDENLTDELHTSGEVYVYSYAQSFTKHIPMNYHDIRDYDDIHDVYADDTELCMEREAADFDSTRPREDDSQPVSDSGGLQIRKNNDYRYLNLDQETANISL